MKKQTLLMFLILFTAGKVFSQFSLEKYFDVKFVNYDNKRFTAMTDLTKKVADEKVDSLPVKITYFITADGKVMKQVLENKNAKQIKKLFDFLYAEIVKKFGKTQNDEEYQGTRNCFWRTKDGTILTLSGTKVFTMLTMMKMQ